MSAPRTRGQAIAAFCKACIADPQASGTWREQVTCCQCTGCALWRFRPLSRKTPIWITSREPSELPEGWTRAGHDAVIQALRAGIDAKIAGVAVRAHGEARAQETRP